MPKERKLKATVPEEAAAGRLKMFLYGPAGVGKTWGCINLLPKAVILDLEGGCTRYAKRIAEQGSVLLQTTDLDEIREELEALLYTKHDYRSVIMDPVTIVYNALQSKYDDIYSHKHSDDPDKALTQDWGMKYWGLVKKEHKGLNTLIERLDMNVAMTAHSKKEYGSNFKVIGETYDGMRGLDYFFDVVLRIYMVGDARFAEVVKERADPESARFEPTFPWDVEKVREWWGQEAFERESQPLELADPEQVIVMEHLVSVLKVPETTLARWRAKAGVEHWKEFPKETLGACIKALEKKLKVIEKEKS